MRKFLLAAVAATVPAFAMAADLSVGQQLGKTEKDVRASLSSMGYEVRKMDDEDGAIEAYAVKGSKMLEVYVDPASGAITRVKGE
jgi:hypothetical protein